MDYALNTRIFGSMYTQWNNEDEQVLLNYRLQIIPKIGTDFYLIVNQLWDTSTGKVIPIQTVVLGKLIWRFVL